MRALKLLLSTVSSPDSLPKYMNARFYFWSKELAFEVNHLSGLAKILLQMSNIGSQVSRGAYKTPSADSNAFLGNGKLQPIPFSNQKLKNCVFCQDYLVTHQF